MDMAGRQLRRAEIALRPVTDVTTADSVRHVDELTMRELAEFLALFESERPARADHLDPGTVVVFTEYYRVTQVV